MARHLATAIIVGSLILVAPAQATPGDTYDTDKRSGDTEKRSGPFVVTDRSLTDLLQDGYEIRGNLGSALVLQKAASVFSCVVPPDPERLSYRPYFVCSELREEPRAPAPKGIAPGH